MTPVVPGFFQSCRQNLHKEAARILLFYTILLLIAPLLVIAESEISATSSDESHSTVVSSEDSGVGFFAQDMAIGRDGNRPNITISSPYVLKAQRSPLDAEEYPVAPAELQLEQVHIYVRHGERTPVGVRMAAPPASVPQHWMMCHTARSFQAAVSSALGSTQVSRDLNTAYREKDEFMQIRRAVERVDGVSAEGECLLGELTDLGRQSTYNYGLSLRKIYVERLGFLPDVLRRDTEVYFRSTNMPRTIASLEHIIHGLYPTTKLAPHVVPSLLVRNGLDENLIGNTRSCRRLELLQIGFAQAAAAAYNQILQPLDEKLSRYIGGNPIRVDGKPRASGILDTVRAAVVHDIPVPLEFKNESIMEIIETAVVQEWFADKTEDVRRLAMGPLLDDLARKMERKVDLGERDDTKILVHSTHDTALAGLCNTLDVFDEKWPPFTASITFELFKRSTPQPQRSHLQDVMDSIWKPSSSRNDHYVRMRYNDKDMVLPLCAEEGKHLAGFPQFCTFAAFQERVKELIPVDWDAECSAVGRP